jgi:hypothetical protein
LLSFFCLSTDYKSALAGANRTFQPECKTFVNPFYFFFFKVELQKIHFQ